MTAKLYSGTSLPLLALCVLLVALIPASPVQAQGTTGSITGNVTDSTGATVPGAIVKVTQASTNEVRTVTSSEAGTYTVPNLKPDTYRVQVSKDGFKTFEQNEIVLVINQVAQINAQLQIGSQQETVTVTSSSPIIQTEASSVGLVIDAQTIQNTPLNGHTSIIGLIALAPGVQGAGAQDQIPVFGITPSIGTGSRNSYGGVGFTLDGTTNTVVTLQRGAAEAPPLDAIAEFKTITTGAAAEFNQPAQVVVVTQSGANKLHGEALEFNRSRGTSAKYFFSGALPRPPYQRNEYGGNISGPVFIPKLYDGRNRSFFFFSYEGFNLTQSSSLTSQQPSVAERGGDFSCFLPGGSCATTPAGTIIKNPLTGLAFTNNMIPSGMLNSVDLQLQTLLYPQPTAPGVGTNTFENVPYTDKISRYSLRMDHRFSDHDQIRGTLLIAHYGPNPQTGTDSLAGGMSGIGEHNTDVILGWTHTFSPTLLLDTYASYFHLPIYRTPQNSNVNFSAIIPGLPVQLIEGAPQISITNISGVSEAGSKDLEQDIQANTALTKVLTHHTIKVGVSFLYDNHWNLAAVTPQRGSYSFNGRYSGIAYADFLLGYPSATSLSLPADFIYRNLSNQLGVFVQDDYKVTPKLTINAGLRYDLQRLLNNAEGTDSSFIPSLGKVAVFANSYPSLTIPAFIPETVLAPNANLGSSLFGYLGQDKNNFAPRLGFAYQPITNTVVRGAFGIYFNLLPGSYAQAPAFSNLPFSAAESFTPATGSIPTITMNAPFAGSGGFAANPSAIEMHKPVTPYTEQYNLTFEHQFGKGLDIRIGYVGQHNVKQNNASGSGNTAPNINLISNPQVGVTAQSTSIYQPFSSINLQLDPIFHSNENSLQIGVHKQYGHGFQLNAEYQWTVVLGTENFENPSGANVNDSYGPIGGITPQVLVVSYSYELPFGHGKALLSNTNAFVDKLIHGFQISGITNIQTGQPFSVSFSAPGTPIGLVGSRANRIPGVPLFPAVKTRAQWFNPAAFTTPLCYNSTGTGPCAALYAAAPAGVSTYQLFGNSAYDLLRGPAFQSWDMSLVKNTTFHERYRIQLRAESFNVFNHPNFNTPNANISNSNVATITGQNGESRTVEFGIKFNF